MTSTLSLSRAVCTGTAAASSTQLCCRSAAVLLGSKSLFADSCVTCHPKQSLLVWLLGRHAGVCSSEDS